MKQDEVKNMLPEYVNGNLSAIDSKLVEQALTESKMLQQECDFLVTLRAVVKQEQCDSPGEWGLVRLRKSLQSQTLEKQPEHLNKQQKDVRSSWWKPIAIAASFVFVVQTAYLVSTSIPDDDAYVPLSDKVGDNVLQLVFSQGVSEAQVRDLMLSIDGRIVGGPSVVGIYRVQVGDLNHAQKLLQDSHLINHVAAE